MGGKRPDQYRITPDEAGATDYKTRPNTPGEAKRSDRTFSEAMESWSQDKQPTAPDVIEPETRKKREAQQRKARSKEEEAAEKEAAASTETEDDTPESTETR